MDDDSGKAIVESNKERPSVIAYQMRPSLQETFRANTIKEIIRKILTSTLQGKTYSVEDARIWTTEICDTLNVAIKELNMKRYKHVVQVMLGQHLGSGCSFLARCLWDAECDNQTSEFFSNTSIFCVCSVFGIYVY